MSKIPQNLFKQIAEIVVPGLRKTTEDLGLEPGTISPTVGLTGTLKINGRYERVRVAVTLDPVGEDGSE